MRFGVEGSIDSNKDASLRAIIWGSPCSAAERLTLDRDAPTPLYSGGASTLTRAKSTLRFARAKVVSWVAEVKAAWNLPTEAILATVARASYPHPHSAPSLL